MTTHKIFNFAAADVNEADVLSVDESTNMVDEKLALDSSIDNAASTDTNVLRNNGNDLLSADSSKSNENILKASEGTFMDLENEISMGYTSGEVTLTKDI